MDKRQRFLNTLETLSPTQTRVVALKLFDELAQLASRPRATPDVVAPPTDPDDAIAIIGMACRFPGGVRSPGQLWSLLSSQRSGIEHLGDQRWSEREHFSADVNEKGRLHVNRGGLVHGIEQFDHALFGISKQEAESMDPHQRQVLEVAWEAFERAGVAPRSLRDAPVGVFIGASGNDVMQVLTQTIPLAKADPFVVTGASLSAIAGRTSYVFGVTGPAMVIDTACSSSLVAIHEACKSLRLGECDMALSGGVNLFLTPTVHIWLSNARMLAPDGECKAFDAAANGYVRSEGCGMFVLKRLQTAVADGDRIHAVIRGSAVNQAGRTQGMTAPNSPSQENVLRKALDASRLGPNDVQFVEAHGTGTSLGDPIEMQAIRSVYCSRRAVDDPIFVGAIKSNIGHCEAAAGAAGLMKAVLALEHRYIPGNLHLQSINPLLALTDEVPLRLPRRGMDWPQVSRRVAAVSSLGFTGSSSHAIVEAYEQAARPADVELPLHIVKVSADSAEAFARTAREYGDYFAALPREQLEDACYTINRQRGDYRFASLVAVRSQRELAASLRGLAASPPTAYRERGRRGLVLELVAACGSDSFAELYRHSQALRRIADANGKIVAQLRHDWAGLQTAWFIAEASSQAALVRCISTVEYCAEAGVRFERIVTSADHAATAACVSGAVSLLDAARLSVDCAAVVTWSRPHIQVEIAGGDAHAVAMRLVELGATRTDSVARSEGVAQLSANGFVAPLLADDPASAYSGLISVLERSLRLVGPLKWSALYRSGNVCQAPVYSFEKTVCNEFLFPHYRSSDVPSGILQLREGWAETPGGDGDVHDDLDVVIVPNAASLAALTPARSRRRIVFVAGKKRAEELLEDFRAVARYVCASAGTDLLVVTRGAHTFRESERIDPAHAALRSMARCFGLEQPERCAGIVDLSIDCAADIATEIGTLLRAKSRWSEWARRDGRTLAYRVELTSTTATSKPRVCDARGTYLVFGGAGGLGMAAAESIAAMGARRLVLASRSGKLKRRDYVAGVDRLRAHGVHVELRACDVTDADAVTDLLAEEQAGGHVVRGIVHAAGTNDLSPLTDIDALTLSATIASKVRGADLLLDRAGALPLEFLVLFSSIAGIWGTAGMGAYAAANRYLDASAHVGRARGLPVFSIAWGPWSEIGMAASEADSVNASGLDSMSPAEGRQVFTNILKQPPGNFVVTRLRLPRFIDMYSTRADAALFDALRPPERKRAVAPLRATLDEVAEGERVHIIADLVARLVANALNVVREDIGMGESLHALGLTSLQALAIRNELVEATAAPLPAALLFEYPTISDVSDYLLERVCPQSSPVARTQG